MNVGITIRPDDTLLITPNTSATSPTQNKLDVTGKSGGVLIRETSYIAGFNIIEIRSNRITAEQKQTIRENAHKLIGPEIIEDTADHMILQDLLNPAKQSLFSSNIDLAAINMKNGVNQSLRTIDHELSVLGTRDALHLRIISDRIGDCKHCRNSDKFNYIKISVRKNY